MLSLHGVIEGALEGAKLASSVKTSKLVLNLFDVRRFASWGMAEWMNFLRAAQELDLYFIECSSYAIQQLSQVTGMLGHGKLVSFYAPFRCGTCSEEQQVLIVVAQAPERLLELTASERPCRTCGGTSRIPKHQADIAHDVASKVGYDIDDDVATFLRAQLKYEIPANLSKFRAARRKQGPRTYLRLSGNLTTLPATKLARAAEGTTVVDLSRTMFDPSQLGPWREFVSAASGNVDTLQLLECPLGFFERMTADDLSAPKLKVRSFVQGYTCPKCSTPSAVAIDVAQHLEELVAGALPAQRCPSCKFEIPGPPTNGPLHKLPARERDTDLDRFVEKMRNEPDEGLENALTLRAPGPKASAVTQRSVYLGSLLAALLVGAIVLVVMFVWKKDAPPVSTVQPPQKPTQTFQRPDWILSDTPSSAYCQEMIGRLMCVGVSAYGGNLDAAVVAANDASLDEIVNLIGLKIEDAWFRDNVLAGYGTARTRTLAAMQNAGPRADDATVRAVRHRVAELLLTTGGPAVPAQRSDWYWEEYEQGSGKGTEFLVFVRYDVTVDSLQLLLKRYGEATSLAESSALTAFPGLAWQDATFSGGAMLRTVGGVLAKAGAVPGQVVTAFDDKPVVDAIALANQLQEATKGTEHALTVRAPDGGTTTITLKP